MALLDTNGGIFPEGTYRFIVDDVPERGDTPGGYAFYTFKFRTEVEGSERTYQERFMVWLVGPLLRALGYPEPKPGVFEFPEHETECLGREVIGTIVHEKIEKGQRAGTTVARMKDIKAAAAKTNGMSADKRAAMKAQAPADEKIPF